MSNTLLRDYFKTLTADEKIFLFQCKKKLIKKEENIPTKLLGFVHSEDALSHLCLTTRGEKLYSAGQTVDSEFSGLRHD